MLVFDKKKGRLIEKIFPRATLNTQSAIIIAFQMQQSLVQISDWNVSSMVFNQNAIYDNYKVKWGVDSRSDPWIHAIINSS